ncbi:hypothetical protein [Phormidesmis priestleyi]
MGRAFDDCATWRCHSQQNLRVEKNVTKLLDRGIRQADVQKLTTAINAADQPDEESKQHGSAIKEELEAIRLRQDKLRQQQVELETMLKDSKVWLGLDDRHFRDTLSVALEIMGSEPMKPLKPNSKPI